MTRFPQNFAAAVAAVAIMLATFVPVISVPPAEAYTFAVSAAPIAA